MDTSTTVVTPRTASPNQIAGCLFSGRFVGGNRLRNERGTKLPPGWPSARAMSFHPGLEPCCWLIPSAKFEGAAAVKESSRPGC